MRIIGGGGKIAKHDLTKLGGRVGQAATSISRYRYIMRKLLLALLVEIAEPHAVMIEPIPRSNIVIPANSNCNWVAGTCPIGNKLSGFNNAITVANRGCGGSANGDPGAAGWQADGGQMPRPRIVAVAGSFITVKWALTVPHRSDIATSNPDSGVRIALHYSFTDSFDCNVLAFNLRAGPDIPDAAAQQTPPLEVAVNLEIPPDKVSDRAVLQFLWAAENDNGYYLSCADLAIVDALDGQKSVAEYQQLPAERGELPVNPRYTRPASYRCLSNRSPEPPVNVGGIVAAVIIILVVVIGVAGGIYYKCKKGGGSTTYAGAIPPPPPPGSSGVALQQWSGPALPPGWRTVPDPASGRVRRPAPIHPNPSGRCAAYPPAAHVARRPAPCLIWNIGSLVALALAPLSPPLPSATASPASLTHSPLVPVSPRAVVFRQRHHWPDDMGTA